MPARFSDQPMLLLTILGVLGSSIWVLIDGAILGIKAPPAGSRRGFLDYGPVGFFIICLLMWIAGFPAYLVKRRRHLAKAPAPQLQEGGLYAACPHCGISLSVSPDLLGRAVVCPTCRGEFTPPAIRPRSWYRGPAPTVAGWAVFAIGLLCCALDLSQLRFREFWLAAQSPRSAAKTAAIELNVRKAIQERLANDSAAKNTEIKNLTLVPQGDGSYRGTLVTQTGGKTEENEVVADYDGGLLRWHSLPRHAAEARTLEWNRQESDALKNGNIAVALQNIFRNPDCRTDAQAPIPALVIKSLPDYYGIPLKLSGKVYAIHPLPAESAFGRALGGKPGSEILFICSDKTVVDVLCTGPNPKVKAGDSATVYGFAIGTTQVPNPLGGVVTRLVLVGPE